MSAPGSSTAAAAPPARRLRSLWLVAFLAAAIYAVLASYADLGSVVEALATLPGWALATAVLMALLNYLLRGWRWRGFLRALGHRLPWPADLTCYIAGFAFTATPGKAGEAARALYLKPWGVGYSQTVGACMAERLLDLITVVTLAAIALYWHGDYGWLVGAAVGLVIAAYLLLGHGGLGALLMRMRRIAPARVARWLARGENTAAVASTLLQGRRLGLGLSVGLCGWLAEAAGFWTLALGLGIGLGWWEAVGIYTLALLAGALSFLPGGLLGVELVMVLLLTRAGAAQDAAVALTLAARVCTLWFSIALGIAALALLPRRPP